MRKFFLAALGVFAVAGVASAQQPQSQPPAAAAVAATPVQAASGATVIRGNGCTNCGTAAPARTNFTMANVTGAGCAYGNWGCQSGCGSVKSDLAFHFGTCKQFFAPCGPTIGGLWTKCPKQGFAAPWGTGYACPPAYDSHNNH